ncbi:response regulator [Agarivorans sp. MS3-6]|uniref:response regulator n=1 Tax=Agarivorans sp. TSD2052 TaxID=2937286 RepID=UPI00200F05EE|nr:response regulator [Agarivorans sp. TSD2052]UPW18861.1 response regulator [Agarivorans sp. TSD2052]
MKLLLIDDDKELTELLGELLELEGFACDIRNDGISGLAQLQQQSYDLVLLDVMMPGKNGFEVLKDLRKNNQQPVLMLTAKGDEIDRVLGLELGADDYLAKPFSERELLARIRAILRRTQVPVATDNHTELICHQDLSLSIAKQQAHCDEQELDLTSTELLLLQQLLEHPGQLLDKHDLNKKVLGKRLQAFDRSLDMHISNLRKKIPARKDQLPRIKTVRGKGYMWLEW